jgi:acetylornithine deacetylase/succinyl-diaminopimelate desuccinylase-like protein
MPEEANLTLDRRLLPGTDVDAAVEEVRQALSGIPPYEVTVRKGVHHLPYQVSPALPHVRALAAAYQAVRGEAPDMGYAQFTFDAGLANARAFPRSCSARRARSGARKARTSWRPSSSLCRRSATSRRSTRTRS